MDGPSEQFRPPEPGATPALGLPLLELELQELQLIDADLRRETIARLRRQANAEAVRAAGIVPAGAVAFAIASFALTLPLYLLGGVLGSLAAVALALLGLLAAVQGFHLLVLRSEYIILQNELRSAMKDAPVLAILLDEQHWSQIGERLSASLPVRLGGHSNFRRFEDHLRYCACHIRSLIDLMSGAEKLNGARVWLGQCVHLLQPLFGLSAATSITLMVLLVLCIVIWPLMVIVPLFALLFGMLIAAVYLPLMLMVFCGRDYIASRAALVAICEMLLADGPE